MIPALRGSLAVLAMMVLFLGAPTSLRAGEKAIKVEIARKHYELGEKLYQVGSYAQALGEFQKAYHLISAPELLFNIARCQEILGNLEEAMAQYRRYLEQRPAAANRALVQGRVASLRSRIAENRRKLTAGSEPVPPPRETTGGGWRRTAGWSTLGVGGAFLITGVVLGALARDKETEYNQGVEAGRTFTELDSTDGTGRRYQAAQIATLVVGGVAAAAGAGLLIWGTLAEKAKTPRVPHRAYFSPFATAQSLGIFAGGWF